MFDQREIEAARSLLALPLGVVTQDAVCMGQVVARALLRLEAEERQREADREERAHLRQELWERKWGRIDATNEGR